MNHLHKSIAAALVVSGLVLGAVPAFAEGIGLGVSVGAETSVSPAVTTHADIEASGTVSHASPEGVAHSSLSAGLLGRLNSTNYLTAGEKASIAASSSVPRLFLVLAADRAISVTKMLAALSTKLAARISAAGSPAALTADLADLNAKTADASTSAHAALSTAVAATVDVSGARTSLTLARQDIVAAYRDALNIVIGLRGSASASTTVQ